MVYRSRVDNQALGMILNKTAITSSTTTYWPLPSGSDLACPCCFCCWSQDCSCGLDIVCSASPKNFFFLLPQSVCRGTHMVVHSPYLRGRDGRMIMLLLFLVVGHSAGGRKHRLKEEIASGIVFFYGTIVFSLFIFRMGEQKNKNKKQLTTPPLPPPKKKK